MPGTAKAGNSGRTSQDLERKVHHEVSSSVGHPSIEVCLVKELNKDVRRVSLEMAKRHSKDDQEHREGHPDVKFHISHGLTTAEAAELMRQWGRNELVEKITPTWLIILRLVCPPPPDFTAHPTHRSYELVSPSCQALCQLCCGLRRSSSS
jgi:hypothetical protein